MITLTPWNTWVGLSVNSLAYYDIRYEKIPNVKRIIGYLEEVMKSNKENKARAATTLAEFYLAQNAVEGNASKAFDHYKMAADQGCLVGLHWTGSCYRYEHGTLKNVSASIPYFEKAAKLGNIQSNYELFLIHSGEFPEHKDVKKAYKHVRIAVESGVTAFDKYQEFFKNNVEELGETFIKQQSITDLDASKTEALVNLHNGYIQELGKRFTKAYENDKLYARASSFLQDVQIWLLGVLKRYFRDEVLRFNHVDFMRAIKEDLLPLVGEVGLYLLDNWQRRLKEKKKMDKRKMVQTCIDIVKSILENHGYQHLEKETKYNMMNRFGPKKCPKDVRKRSHVKQIYSYVHYARPEYFESEKKKEDLAEEVEFSKKCEYCKICKKAESKDRKHKICSACKQAFYCSVECQRSDWKSGHKYECKDLIAKANKK
jgi:hypothetical protein